MIYCTPKFNRYMRWKLISIFFPIIFGVLFPAPMVLSGETLPDNVLKALQSRYHIDENGDIYYYPFKEHIGSWYEFVSSDCVITRRTLVSIAKRDDCYITNWTIECRRIDGERLTDYDGIGQYFAGTDEKPVKLYPAVNIYKHKYKIDDVQINNKNVTILTVKIDDNLNYYLSNDIPLIGGYVITGNYLKVNEKFHISPPCPAFPDNNVGSIIDFFRSP